jgi:hypothetical protein
VLFNHSPDISGAIQREMKGMRGCLPSTHAPRPLNANGDAPSSRLAEFLEQIGERPIRASLLFSRLACC